MGALLIGVHKMKIKEYFKRYYKMALDLVMAKVYKKGQEPVKQREEVPFSIPELSYWETFDYSWSNNIAPLFAYVQGNTSHARNQQVLAKYPLIIVNPSAANFINYDAIKAINPNIKILAYVMVEDELVSGNVSSPFNDILKAELSPSTFITINGVQVRFFNGTYDVRVRDTRSTVWQQAFLSGCNAQLSAYPFDGLFLDNCYIIQSEHDRTTNSNWNVNTLGPTTAHDMRVALNSLLLTMKNNFPGKIFIGNGASYLLDTPILTSLSGAMTEQYVNRVPSEGLIRSYASPIYNVFVDYVNYNSEITTERITPNATTAFTNKMFYGITPLLEVDSVWPNIFDEIKTSSGH